MKHKCLTVMLCCLAFGVIAQETRDSARNLDEVTVKAYFVDRPILNSPASVSVLDASQLSKHAGESLVTAMNTVPGVRMEERSPGSYRLSIRGSLLRSPFGVRNVKIYLDEFPLTDAGGNSYFNLLDASGINRIEILKGPDASIFGANSGGVLVLSPFRKLKENTRLSGSITGGSYGLIHQKASVQQQWKKYSLGLTQAYQHSDGYRENSSIRRQYADLAQQWQYSNHGQLRSNIIYSDLYYKTPGGLTAGQADLNPRSARPAAGKIPGATEQRAGIYNKTLMAGLLNEIRLSENLRQVVSVFGTNTDFKNPFITNYETRRERSSGIRTFAELKGGDENMNWQLETGLESQSTSSDISNYANNSGVMGSLQSSDCISASQDFIFAHAHTDILKKLVLEVAASINFYKYSYISSFPLQTTSRIKRFKARFMPRVAASYSLNESFAVRATASKGFSAPTIAEVRSSDNIINTSLQPEAGWNYEAGGRFTNKGGRVSVDISVFDFRLRNAIVRRLNANDTEYFINAGGTKQLGLECQFTGWIQEPTSTGPIRGIQLRNSYTRSNFIFSDYKNANADYSGNHLTGVPQNTFNNSIYTLLPGAFSMFIQHSFTSEIPLNDLNSVYSESYNLVSAKVTWLSKKGFQVFVGADNLLNTSYSLGNDLNAVSNRYFNPAPGRNYYAGISVNWQK